MPHTTNPLVQVCTACGALIDVSDEEPFSLMHCPTCGGALRVRTRFGIFELQELLGAGGVGAVYRALDTNLNRAVAIKLLRKEFSANPEFIKQFEHEASITALINHPNVVKVYSNGTDHGLYYIVMELVDKGSLDDLMMLQGQIGEMQVLEVGIQIANGLDAAYKRGLIHRDIKPGNILFADANHAKIVDFGLAAPLDQAGDLGGEIWGTPYYVAPEKLDRVPREDVRSDLYSLGATLFHAIAGRPPYEAEDASVVALKHLKSQPVRLQAFAPDVSNATAYVINKTLEKEPENRYQSYEELAEHLEYARTQLLRVVAQPQHKNRVTMEDDRSQRLMSVVTLGVFGAALLGAGGLYLFKDKIFGHQQKGPPAAVIQAHQAAAIYGPKYENAQALLMIGKVSAAGEAFAQLEKDPSIPQPLHNWITLQGALCSALEGKWVDARPQFEKLVERGAYSFDPDEEKLASFFLSIGKLASDTTPTPSSATSEYSKSNFESIALFVLALKDWELGSTDDAATLFQEFHSVNPDEPYAWIGSYRDLTIPYTEDYSIYRKAIDSLDAAKTPDQLTVAIAAARAALPTIKHQAKFVAQALDLTSDLQKKAEKMKQEEEKRKAADLEAETKAVASTKAKVNALCLQYKFSEALTDLASVSFVTPLGRQELITLQNRCEALANFKASLIQDITTLEFPGPLQKKTGSSVLGVVRRANDQQLESVTPYGSMPVLWTELAPDTIIAMARSFIRSGMPPEQIEEKKWNLGMFSLLVGKRTDGLALLTEVAKSNAQYKALLQPILDSTEKP